MMNVLDLFSGIGGFSLGLERAGMKTVAFCEYDEKCRQVLKKHWPDVPQYTDVRTLTGEQLKNDGIGPIDVICGGYPCQPFSVAGRRQGEADDRHLWPEFYRLVQEIRPTWVIGENVAGHINMGLDCVLADLENAGYQSQTFLIPACAVGAYHRRDRVWVIAYASSVGSERLQHELGKSCEGGQGRESDATDCVDHAADPMCRRQQGPRRSVECSDSAPGKNWKVDRAFDALRWPTKPPVRGRNDGVSGRLDKDRLRQLGNAVVPQIPEVIGRAIMESA